MTRSELRKKIMIILYQIDICKERNVDVNIDEIIKDNINIENDFVKEIVNGVCEKKDELDKLANDSMINWTIDRIDKTSQAILRMAIYELKYTETPYIVVINEAVELAKIYSDDSVRKIINAVLDNIVRK